MGEKISGHLIRKERAQAVYKKIEHLYYEERRTLEEIVELVKQPNGRPYTKGSIRQILFNLNK